MDRTLMVMSAEEEAALFKKLTDMSKAACPVTDADWDADTKTANIFYASQLGEYTSWRDRVGRARAVATMVPQHFYVGRCESALFHFAKSVRDGQVNVVPRPHVP